MHECVSSSDTLLFQVNTREGVLLMDFMRVVNMIENVWMEPRPAIIESNKKPTVGLHIACEVEEALLERELLEIKEGSFKAYAWEMVDVLVMIIGHAYANGVELDFHKASRQSNTIPNGSQGFDRMYEMATNLAYGTHRSRLESGLIQRELEHLLAVWFAVFHSIPFDLEKATTQVLQKNARNYPVSLCQEEDGYLHMIRIRMLKMIRAHLGHPLEGIPPHIMTQLEPLLSSLDPEDNWKEILVQALVGISPYVNGPTTVKNGVARPNSHQHNGVARVGK